ncbi:MAG: DUF3108 domain-containing protein [Chitinophagaceae bacterium]|nr:DUF3108 domain-containing protein [Chitinophagaceae bacterium]
MKAQNDKDSPICKTTNRAFIPGESLTYTVFYSVVGAYFNAGTANFSVYLENLDHKPVYRVVATGTSNSGYDFIFQVRDRYESYFDTATLLSMKFIRDISEGKYKKRENVTFNRTAGTAVTSEGVFKTPECIHDVVSAMYNVRNIDFAKYKPGDKIPFQMFMDNQTYNLYIRYLGKETIQTKYGKFNAIKFSPLLLKGSLFEGGEKMTAWLSDDPNNVLLRVETPISVGSIKVDLVQYRNIRYPLSSRIE